MTTDSHYNTGLIYNPKIIFKNIYKKKKPYNRLTYYIISLSIAELSLTGSSWSSLPAP
jgi:hypothetical protein